MSAYVFFSLIFLCLIPLVIGIAATWYKVFQINALQGLVSGAFLPFLFLFGALHFKQTKWSYISLLAGSVGSVLFFGYLFLIEGSDAL